MDMLEADEWALDILKEARPARLFENLTAPKLVAHALKRGEAQLSRQGALVAKTGTFTGRSPRDKFIVSHPSIDGEIDWQANKSITHAQFQGLRARAIAYLNNRELYVQHLYAGADPHYRLKVRVITEKAWHNLFARNMFIRPELHELAAFEADWTVLQLPGLQAHPEIDGTQSSTAIVIDFASRTVLVAGTAYAGEIKKSIFTVMNFLLPAQNVMPMHGAANVGPKGDAAIFFGLSGTGKTTLSADPGRTLLGDDEHGWSEQGIFNFEGGCYAKTIRLSQQAEPEIFAASTRFGAILENVVLDPVTSEPDWDDDAITENTRSCYPLDFIPNASRTGRAGTPANIVMLTADAFGVLPPIAKLSTAQAMYHFLSGYTAKVAGTERGLTEPEATFSACFGAPFMPRRPVVYARLLGAMMQRHKVDCWLVNTGWTGGAYGTGRRMPIQATRRLLQAALSGELGDVSYRKDPIFGLMVPKAIDGVDEALLDPRSTWADKAAFDRTARHVAQLFAGNFQKFENEVDAPVREAAIRPLAKV